jgi:hypothetical protein
MDRQSSDQQFCEPERCCPRRSGFIKSSPFSYIIGQSGSRRLWRSRDALRYVIEEQLVYLLETGGRGRIDRKEIADALIAYIPVAGKKTIQTTIVTVT